MLKPLNLWTVEFDKAEMAELRARLEGIPRGIETAAIRAANKTAAHGRTLVKRELSKGLRLKSGVILRTLAIDKANRNIPAARLQIRSKEINLIHYGAERYGTRMEGGIMATFGRKTILKAGAFIVKGLSGKSNVFQRTGVFRVMKAGRYIGRKREVIKGVPGPLSAKDILDFGTPIMQAVKPALAVFMKHQLQEQVKFLVTARGRQTLARAEELRARGD